MGIVFNVEKLSRVDTAKGTGLTTTLSLKIVPSLFLPICGVHNLSFDLNVPSSSLLPKSLGLFAEIDFRCPLKNQIIYKIKESVLIFNTLFY